MARKFLYDGREFPDPDPDMTVEEVKKGLAGFYGELDNAGVTETKQGEDTVYEFQRRVGTKGAETEMGQMGQMDHGKIMEILDRAPPFHPRILGITRDLTGPDGTIDQEAATLRTEEIETAQQEARNYTEAVGRLRAAISCRI